MKDFIEGFSTVWCRSGRAWGELAGVMTIVLALLLVIAATAVYFEGKP